MKIRLNKNQYDTLMNLPIRYCYKHKIKRICEKQNIRVESVLTIFFVFILKIWLFFPKEL